MKKILIVIFVIGTFLLFGETIYAESFIEGKFINGEYITKDKGNTHLYVTMQYITTKSGDIVYCLEPFVTFMPGSNYNEIVGDLSSYSKLSSEQIKRIELLSFFGYGYRNRMDDKWYVITQYLIWQTVDKDATFSFTSTLNGSKVKKYESEIAEIERDIVNRNLFAYKDEFVVNYNDDLNIPYLISSVYEVVDSDYTYTQNNTGVNIKEVKENGVVSFRKKSNYYKDKVKIYDHSSNQDLIKPGNVIEPTYDIDIVVQKGKFTLNILKDESVYTVESDFNNTCYEVSGEGMESILVCTGEDEMTYISDDLPYGDYEIRQVSNGVGYVVDSKTYKFTIDKTNNHPVITVNNFLIKNTINILKYACRDNVCDYEKDAVFSIKDKNGNLVEEIVTSNEGRGSLLVGYGLYYVTQEKGMPSYTMIDSYSEKIVDETDIHSKTLYNNYIGVEEPEVPKEEVREETKEPEIVVEVEQQPENIVMPPKTSVDSNLIEIIIRFLLGIWNLFIIV